MVKAGAMVKSRYTVIHWKKSLLRRYLAPETQKTQGNSWKISEARKRRTRKRPRTKRNSLNTWPCDHSLRSKGESYNNNALPSTGKHHGNIRLPEKRRKISSTEEDDDGVYSLAPVSFPPSRLSPRPSQTIVATFHQRSGRRGLSVKYRGYQCTSMALAAIIVSKTMPLQNWRTPDLDAILRYGDLLHADLLHLRGRRLNDPRLALHEIPTGESNKYSVPVPDRNEKWFTRDYPIRQFLTLSKSEDYYGLVHPPATSQQQYKDLGYTVIEDAIDIVLKQDFDGALITVGDVSGSVFKDSAGKIKYFDSHSNNKWGRLSIDGTAVLLTFDTIRDFVRLIRKREPRISYRYELIGLKVHVIKAQKNTDGNRKEQKANVPDDSRYDLPKDTFRTAQPEDSKKVEEQVYVGFEITVGASNTSNISGNITDGSENVQVSIEETECTNHNTDVSGGITDETLVTADCAGNITVGTEDISDLTGDTTNDMEDNADEADEIADLTDNTVNGIEDIADGSQDIRNGIEDNNAGTDDIIHGTEPIIDGTEYITVGTDDIVDGTEGITDGTDDFTEGTEDNNEGTEDITEGTGEVAQSEQAATEYIESIEDYTDDVTKPTKAKIDGINNGTEDTADRIEDISDGTEYIIAARDGDTYGIRDSSCGTEDISDERSAEDQQEDLIDTEWEITAEANAPTDMSNSIGNTEHFGQKVSNDDNDDVDISIDITEHADITTIVGKQLSRGNEDVPNAVNVDNVSVFTRNSFLEITDDGLNAIEVIDLSD